MLNWRNLECSGNLGAHRDAATMRSAQFPNKISPILPNPPCPSASVRTSEDRKLPIYFPVLLWSLCQGSASQFSSRLFENFPCSLYKTSHKLKP